MSREQVSLEIARVDREAEREREEVDERERIDDCEKDVEGEIRFHFSS